MPEHAPPRRAPHAARRRGFTIIELLMSVLVVGVLAAVAYPAYAGYLTRSKTKQAVQDIVVLSALVQAWQQDQDRYPDSLADVLGPAVPQRDPWGNPYQYLNLQAAGARGLARKDHSLVPINSDFDLYSMGPDGRSEPPLTARMSRDDIVRANDGRYVGVASDY